MNLPLSLLLPLALGNPPAAGPRCDTCRPSMPLPQAQRFGPPMIPQPCPPSAPPAPLLATRLLMPEGTAVTVLPGSPEAKTFKSAVTVGFRPGYAYKLAVTGIVNRPGETLYPTLEVRGSIVPRPTTKYMDYAAPIFFTKADLERAATGVLVTKVIYLEDPKKAEPVASKPDQPLEFTTDTEEEAFRQARDNGRLVAILRIGDRKPSDDELRHFAIAGTVLFPGDAKLAAPAFPPPLPCLAVPMFDPILGPKPSDLECFTDGGDKGPALGVGPGGKLGGLDPTDVAAEYTVGGKKKVVTSNEVCICVPRFVIRRADLGLGAIHRGYNPDATSQKTNYDATQNQTPPQLVANREKPVGIDASVRPSIQVGKVAPHEYLGSQKPVAQANTVLASLIATFVEPDEITSFPNQLLLSKEVDPKGPLNVGDTVTITLKYHNSTRQPVKDLVVSDSLSGRLEYVAGSASSDRPANVTTSENEAGSVVVRFEIPVAIPPNQGGVVKFRATVR